MIGTHGRGFYVMDNIAPLRELRSARCRRRPSCISSSPQTARRGLDRNVSFDYSLEAAVKNVTIEFLDGKGASHPDVLERRGRGREGQRPEPPAERRRTSRAARRSPSPRSSPGHHRLNWDMRYPGATEFPGLIMWAASSRGPARPSRDLPGARDRGWRDARPSPS